MAGPALRLTPDLLLAAYAAGAFPMAESRGSAGVHWLSPQTRGLLPLEGPHISRHLARRLRRGGFSVSFDQAFAQVLAACAARAETWINAEIAEAYQALFAAGHAHSVEIWEGGRLIGGLYGVALGGAFFGESMVSPGPDGSKLALVFLLHRLRAGGFQLFDTQYLTPHLATLGGYALPRAAYLKALKAAIAAPATFDPPGYALPLYGVTAGGAPSAGAGGASGTKQRRGQTS